MPAVTRIGDADVVHCSRPNRLQGSDNVFVNGIGVSRQGDNNTVHVLPGLALSCTFTTYCRGFNYSFCKQQRLWKNR